MHEVEYLIPKNILNNPDDLKQYLTRMYRNLKENCSGTLANVPGEYNCLSLIIVKSKTGSVSFKITDSRDSLPWKTNKITIRSINKILERFNDANQMLRELASKPHEWEAEYY